MKTALLHYWLLSMRGGENVLAEIARLYPDADIFTHAYRAETMDRVFGRHKITESFIGHFPGARKSCQKYLPFMPLALERFDLNGYDLIISSESGPAKGIRKPADAKHICYCHTPMRYVWDMYEDYYRAAGLGGKIAMKLFRKYLQKYDLRSAGSVDLFVANSRFVAERIKRIYRRDSVVVHPPVDCGFFSEGKYCKKEYYLFAGQLIPYKRPDLALEACRKLGRKLVFVGTGSMEKELKKRAGHDVEFAGRVSGEKLRQYYAEARALLFPGIEDFGIVPLEAQAAGTPVIAFGAGGALETVQANKTGLFFDRADAETLAQAILEFENRIWDDAPCRTRAAEFSPSVFREKFRDAVQSVLPQK